MEDKEILYDHYKETFCLSKDAQGRRNKSFIILCVLEALSFLILVKPEKVLGLIDNTIKKELNMALTLGNTVIQTLIWLIITYVLIRYVQDMLYIERQYTYLEKLEGTILSCMDTNIFSREGDNYSSNYPMVLNFIDLFYKLLSPILFMTINTVRIYKEYIVVKKVTLALVCDTILYLAIFVITWFYFFEVHSKITSFCKKNIPLIAEIACRLRKILKEV